MADREEILKQKIENWKRSLLDMTRRNNLLWYKPKKVNSLKIESAILDNEGDPRTAVCSVARGDGQIKFDPTLVIHLNDELHEYLGDTDQLSLIEEQDTNEDDEYAQHLRSRIAKIKKRDKAAKGIAKFAKDKFNEKGLNTAYIAYGFIRWFERDDSEEIIKSPLILIPVKISQETRISDIVIELNTDEDIAINPVIIKKFKDDFRIDLGVASIDTNDINSTLEQIKNIISRENRWGVVDEIWLDSFDFQNLVIWDDLNKNYDLVMDSPFGQILGGATPEEVGLDYGSEEINLARIKAKDNPCILPADSSQLEVIERANLGQSFVIQGPPGTGKSQTIANIIATSLYSGKKILFVSEKQAALDVVRHKLERVQLADFCLVMHNSKQKKSNVREQLQDVVTLAMNKRKVAEESLNEYTKLDNDIKILDDYALDLHEETECGKSSYFILGELANLSDVPSLPFSFPDGFDFMSNYEKVTETIFDFVGRYAESFIDNTAHFSESMWRYYSGQFDPSTRRTMIECLGDAGVDRASSIAEKYKQELVTRETDSATAVADTLSFREIFDQIPFKLTNKDFYSQQIGEIQELDKSISELTGLINDANSSTKKANARRKEIKTYLSSRFDESVLSIKSVKNKKVRLESIYGSPLKRLFDANYKLLISELVQSELCKLKYADYCEAFALIEEYQKLGAELDKVSSAINGDPRSEKDSTRLGYKKRIEYRKDKTARCIEAIGNEMQADVIKLRRLLDKINYSELDEYSAHVSARNELIDGYGLQGFIDSIEFSDDIYDKDEILRIFKKRFFELLLERTEFSKKHYGFSRSEHDRIIKEFRAYDKKSRKISALMIRCKLLERMPDMSPFSSASSVHAGEIGLLKKELAKKSRLLPTRRLIESLPTLAPSLKPCMMMSPLTVSSYFGKNPDFKFDIVIFDEASQVKPEYAVPAIVRGKQIIVAGDSKQMPPTNFFDAGFDQSEDYLGEDEVDDSDLESILDEMSVGLPDKHLDWHYRSKDESLIAFSNNKFYNSRLYTFPSVDIDNKTTGVSFEYCPEGVWISKAGNANEASRVAALVYEHFLNRPEDSLGIVSPGVAQQTAIQDAIDKMRDMHPEMDEFFDENKDEPFFNKNLENVQGDERDCIIFSCGYGKDPAGVFRMNFGPITRIGGERRLNVAVSRSRKHMTIVSSFKASEVKGVEDNERRKIIRDLVDYAEHGITALLGEQENDKDSSDGEYTPEFDSPFEEAVYDYLVSCGYRVRTQVGSSGYRIDMAVIHPKIEGRYAIAIECDGAAYHSSRTARDRDILRQDVLESLGWKFYRIWSTNWISDQEKEKEKLKKAVEDAIAGYDNVSSEESDEDLDVSDVIYTESANKLKEIYEKMYKLLRNEIGYGYYSYSAGELYRKAPLEKILREVVPYMNGYVPSDIFKAINRNVFRKMSLSSIAHHAYEAAFMKLVKDGTVSIGDDGSVSA